MSAARKTEDSWDFYYCLIEDAPASVFFNLAYEKKRPKLTTLYYVSLQLLEPDDHGMGSSDEAEALWPVEDAIGSAAKKLGLAYVGRMRNDGSWQLTFYGKAGHEEALEDIVEEALDDSERGYRCGSKKDADWRYYREFLWPDEERWQWILDRRIVEQLTSHGDDPDIPREVDHLAHFPAAKERDTFAAAVEKLGFRTKAEKPKQDDDLPYGISLQRKDPVEIEHIHEVVMTVRELAEEHSGDYDGWGCTVATTANA